MKKLSQKNLANLVSARRKEKGITQQQLSDRTGINRAMLSHIESEEYIPSILQLQALGDELGFDVEEVFRKGAMGEQAEPDGREAAEPLHGTTLLRLAPWARKLEAHIMTGSFVERCGSQYYNTSALMDSRGILTGTYRKIHLFGYDSQERQLLTAGSQTSEVLTSYGVVGMATCYDLRFPEQFRRMVSRSAEMFLVCAAWPKARAEDWELLCRARALENQSFLLACNT